MAHWHTPLWISALCLATGCGSNPPQPPNTAAEIAPAETIEETSSEATQSTPQSIPSAPQHLASDQPVASDSLSEPTIVPGERVGPITRNTSRAELAEMFGESALKDTEVPVGEGFTESGTEVNLDNTTTFSVIWVDSSQSQPATVKDFGPAWQTPEGIHIGTSFTELQAILGEFELYGFGWDYGGTVVLESSDLSDYYGSLILRLQPADPATFQQQSAAFQAVQGDQILPSTNPNLASLNLVVDEMIVYLNPPR